MMMMKDPAAAAAAAAALSRRPRAQSLQGMEACASPTPGRECCSSGSFVSKLYRMVDSEPSTIVSWIRGGSAFCIVDPKMLAEHCLPKYFRHRRFSSLIRQLNFYSFYRVQEGQLTIYQHSFFRKGRPDLLVHIKRRGAGKAKDPWFDPLAAAAKPQMAVEAPPAGGAMSAVACFSPMAKPLSIENMSPALKPGMAPTITPPAVDLGAADKRWEMLKRDDCYPLASALTMRHELLFDGRPPMAMTPTAAMPPATVPSPLDLDMDFLTDDQGHLDAGADPRIASVARDCLKWDLKGDEPALQALEADDQDRAFENELLLDLANVTPEAWEVPLSPLNESEVTWGDLCF